MNIRTPASRATDPASSHAAEAEINATGTRATQQAQVLGAVHQFPNCTSRELAYASGIDRYIVARRLPELETAGFIDRGTLRRCSASRRLAVTWHPAPVQIEIPSRGEHETG